MKYKIIGILLLSLLSISVHAFSSCDQMFAYGYPTSNLPSTVPLCRIAYYVEYNPGTKNPVYSAEYLLKENISASVKRVNAFKADPDLLPLQRAELSDYTKVYDRGHMTPFEDTTRNSAASLQSFYLSNMCPQNLHLNRGLWRQLENKVRKFAIKSENGLYIITGPIYSATNTVIGANRVYVPISFYKIVIDKMTNRSIAYIIPNTSPNPGIALTEYATAISDVELMTGINFTPLLPIEKESLKTHIDETLLQELN